MCLAFALLIAGCGGGSGSNSQSSPPVPAFLDGNWLLVGSLPFATAAQTDNSKFGLAITFTVIGNQIAAAGSTQIPCGSTVLGSGFAVSGNAGSDGSFSVQTPATQPSDAATLQIKGAIPSAADSTWTGTYSFSNGDSSCPFTGSGPITAVRIGDLAGTYSGSASLQSRGSTGAAQPVSVSLALQQGLPTAGPAGTQTVEESVLTGGVNVQGTSCFSTGQIVQSQPPVQGSILGTNVLATFTMDDGSHLFLTANIEDTASSKLGVVMAQVSGGKCDGQFIDSFEAARQ